MTGYFARMDLHTRNLHDMMQHCDVTMAELAAELRGMTAAAVVRSCISCRAAHTCRDWLDARSGAAAGEAPPFCPNRRRFAMSRLGRTAAHPQPAGF